MNTFSSSDWIAVATCIISSFLSLFLYQRIRKKKIIFLLTDNFKINSVDFSNFYELKMIFKNEEINKFLYFYSGTLIMTGDEDIEEDNIKHPISLVLEDKTGQWKHYNIIRKTELLNCSLEHNQQTLKFITKEIKKNDFIHFNAYYNGVKSGAKFHHRIINVNSYVEVINEKESPIYKGAIVFFSIILLFLGTSILSDFFSDNLQFKGPIKYTIQPPYTQHSNFEPMTKKDSLREKRNKYNNLYIVNHEKLKSDSIFIVNRKLNNKKNDLVKKEEYKKIDSLFKNKNSTYDKIQIELQKKLIKEKDILYYENDYSITDKTDNLIYRLLEKDIPINKTSKYKINDSISVSFIEQDNTSKNSDVSYLILRIILFLFMASYNFILIYKVYLLYKYGKICRN